VAAGKTAQWSPRAMARSCRTKEEGRGEVGHDQSRVEGLGVALTGGGGRWRGLDEIRCGGMVSAPEN
jgi:hypothetical protein